MRKKLIFLCLVFVISLSSCIGVKTTFIIKDIQRNLYFTIIFPFEEYSVFKLKFISIDRNLYSQERCDGLLERNDDESIYFKIDFTFEYDYFNHYDSIENVSMLTPYIYFENSFESNYEYAKKYLSSMDYIYLICKRMVTSNDSILYKYEVRDNSVILKNECTEKDLFISNIFEFDQSFVVKNDKLDFSLQNDYELRRYGDDNLAQKSIQKRRNYYIADVEQTKEELEHFFERCYGLCTGTVQIDMSEFYEAQKTNKGDVKL